MEKRWTKKPGGKIPRISECKRMIDWNCMTCLGFAKSEDDDEPIECCKYCRYIETKDYDHPFYVDNKHATREDVFSLFGEMRHSTEEESQLYKQMLKNVPHISFDASVLDL